MTFSSGELIVLWSMFCVNSEVLVPRKPTFVRDCARLLNVGDELK